MATGGRRLAAGQATGPSVGPRLVPLGAEPGVASDQPRLAELRYVAIEAIDPTGSAAEDGTGAMTVTLLVPHDRVWAIDRLAVSTTSTTVTTCQVYVGRVDPANLVDLTANGNADIADEVNSIRVPAGSALIARWTGASAGSVATIRAQGTAGALQQVPVR